MTDHGSEGWDVLAPGVHVVSIDEDLVFLDVLQDRYACLPGAALVARADVARTRLQIDDLALGQDLRAAGLTTDTPAERRPWRPPPRPTSSAMTMDVEPPRWRDLGEAGCAMVDVWLAYRGRSLSSLLLGVRRQEPQPSRASAKTDPLDVVARFHRWAPFAPTSAKCLLRTFMLLRLLQRQGHGTPLWVFGVRTAPFEAHCWLQIGDMVLDDDLDRVAALEPILVV